jgi:4-amino-4-deoxy-L-arabinose transferase-like glycosyltransferase
MHASSSPASSVPAPGSAPGDRAVIAVIACCFVVLAALSWRKWGTPEIDAGVDLTTADLIKHGALAYGDVRYYYGPLGIYSLALGFKVFGTSFTTAYGFGLLQAGGILAAFYALARHWLIPLTAGLATAVLLAIGFSGTAYNFVLPNTSSATLGILCLLLALLALSRERPLLAGAAIGMVGLTRPEYVALAAGMAAAYALATWRVTGLRSALQVSWRLALPAIAIPAVVLGWFAARVGLSKLVTENLWPVKFLHGGVGTERHWAPFDVSSVLGLLARGTIYVVLLGALVVSVQGFRRARQGGYRRVAALWPLAAAALALVTIDGLLHAGGLLGAQRAAIELEARHLVLGMSVLPALCLAVAVLAAVRLIAGRDSPLGRTWPADLALIVVAAGLGLRAYNAFTTEGSYAPYYAAPLVLILGILHERVAERRPAARGAVLAALGLIALGLATYAVGGLYRHDTTAVHTKRGTFVTTTAAAAAVQATVDRIDADTTPGQPIFAAPTEGGLYFMSARRPALYDLALLPGLIATPAEQRAAIARLRDEHVPLAVIAARNLSVWSTHTFGVDYDKILGGYLRSSASSRTVAGSLSRPAGGTIPSNGFTISRLSGS